MSDVLCHAKFLKRVPFRITTKVLHPAKLLDLKFSPFWIKHKASGQIGPTKTSLAPIERLPPEILSVIPDYCDEDSVDKVLISLTGVCRLWRGVLMDRSSLWTRLHFRSIDETRAYIQRSESSPLNIYLGDDVIDDVFALVIPHIGRVRSLTVSSKALPKLLKHFHRNVPPLEKLDIEIHSDYNTLALDDALFSGNLSNLRELRLHRVNTRLPRTKLPNLRVFALEGRYFPNGTTEILDFLQSAPLLHTVTLTRPLTDPSDAPPGRIVHLRNLKHFTFLGFKRDLFLLSHLAIPIGASFIIQGFPYGEKGGFQILSFLPELLPDFSNLSNITTAGLSFSDVPESFARLKGPSGSLCASGSKNLRDGQPPIVMYRNVLKSLSHPMLLKIQMLAITAHWSLSDIEFSFLFHQRLSFANNLRTLALIGCRKDSESQFIRMLDPEEHISSLALCPRMEELVFESDHWPSLHKEELIKMLKNRASLPGKTAPARISSITWVDGERSQIRKGPSLWWDRYGELFRAMDDIGVKGRINDKLPDWCTDHH